MDVPLDVLLGSGYIHLPPSAPSNESIVRNLVNQVSKDMAKIDKLGDTIKNLQSTARNTGLMQGECFICKCPVYVDTRQGDCRGICIKCYQKEQGDA